MQAYLAEKKSFFRLPKIGPYFRPILRLYFKLRLFQTQIRNKQRLSFSQGASSKKKDVFLGSKAIGMLECDWKEFINETKKVGDFSLCKV